MFTDLFRLCLTGKPLMIVFSTSVCQRTREILRLQKTEWRSQHGPKVRTDYTSVFSDTAGWQAICYTTFCTSDIDVVLFIDYNLGIVYVSHNVGFHLVCKYRKTGVSFLVFVFLLVISLPLLVCVNSDLCLQFQTRGQQRG